jgi:hypothetical protein
MSKFTRASRVFLVVVGAALVGFAGGWIFTSIKESVVLAESSQILESASLRVVYISGGDVPEVSGVAQSQNVVTLQAPDLATRLDVTVPIDVLVFDASLKNQLDQQWIQTRYLDGMAIVGINVGVKELADFVGDSTAASGPWGEGHPGQPFFSLLQLVVRGDDPEDVKRYLSEYPSLVNPDGSYEAVEGITSSLSVSRSKTQAALSEQDAFDKFFQRIAVSVTDPTP